MTLVYRTDQTTPLTNKQVDDNFKFLKDEVDLKYSISDFTAAKISLKLNTPASGQNTTLALAESNALNAWLVRDLVPFSNVPISANKSSLVARNTNGEISATTVYGALSGNASSATLAASATKLETPRNINGVAFDGTSNITVADNTKLPILGGALTGKLSLPGSIAAQAPINIGVGLVAPDEISKVNGDVWTTSSGVFYHLNGQTNQFAPLASPTFTGIPQAPGFAGAPDQIITLSHLSNAVSTLNTSISTKANIASPTFTGIPQAPTAASNTNNTQIATTAFVTTKLDAQETAITGAYQQYTTNAVVSYSNTVNQLLALKANLASPEFTGTPRSTTPTTGDNSSRIATTAFTAASISTFQNTVNSAIAALQDLINSTRPVPAGSVFYMAGAIVPYGYLECDGSWVLKATYEDLWQALGSPILGTGNNAGKFKLPDLRGEFVRGWDHGRGVDVNRQILSSQQDQIERHKHVAPYSEAFAAPFGQTSGTGYQGSGRTDYDNYLYHTNDGSDFNGPVNSTDVIGDETRPRNVALMPIIKW